MIFFVGACRPGLKTPPDTLVVGLEAIPTAGTAQSAVSNISQLVHNGLFRLSQRMEIEPDLAESYEFVPPKKYKIHLRAGVRFHDGRLLKAEDVKATLESGLPPKIAEKVESINVTAPLDLEIELKEPFAPFLSALTIGIIPEGGNPVVGTGPFQLERSDLGGEIVLKRVDGFRIRFRVIPDENLRVLEIKNGRIDLLQNNVPSSLLPSLKNAPELMTQATGGMNTTYLGMNLRKGPLVNGDVREAIALALDVPALIDYRMARLARPAASVLSPIHWAHEGEVMTYFHDSARARELLDRAGYPDPDQNGPRPRMTLTYKTPAQREWIGLARLIARHLDEVGIEVKIVPADEANLFNDLGKGNFDLYSSTWMGTSEPDFSSCLIQGGYENPAIDLLTANALAEMDQQKRKGVYSMIQKVLSQDLPIIPLWYEDNYAIFSRWVKGLQLRPNGSFDWALEIYKEKR